MKLRPHRNPSRVLGPIAVSAAIACALACLALPATAADVTYSHMVFDDKCCSAWKDGSWRADVDPEHTTRVYNGACSLEVTLKAKGALCFLNEKGKDVSHYHALVGWIHGGSEGGQSVRVVLTDTEGNILPNSKGVRLATAAHVQGGEIIASRWQFFVIPVSELKPGYRDTTRIAFYNPTKETMPTFYLDDVGFTSQKVPLFSTSGEGPEDGGGQVPGAQREAHVVYGDSLENGWENWSWNSSVELNNKDRPGEGQQAILVDQKPEGGLAFGRHDAFQAAGYRTLEFHVNGGQAGGQHLSVSLFDDNGQIISTVLVSNRRYLQGGAITGNAWQRVSIPLRDFRAGQTAVSKIAIINVGSEATTYYVDAVCLVK